MTNLQSTMRAHCIGPKEVKPTPTQTLSPKLTIPGTPPQCTYTVGLPLKQKLQSFTALLLTIHLSHLKLLRSTDSRFRVSMKRFLSEPTNSTPFKRASKRYISVKRRWNSVRFAWFAWTSWKKKETNLKLQI